MKNELLNVESKEKRMHRTFKVYSANANSIKNKLDSLKFNILTLDPDVIIIQESKLKRKSQFDLPGFECFPTIRGDSGGGILIACKHSFKPILIYEGNPECEVLVIEIKVNSQTQIRVIAGYGPQECAPSIVREAYRNAVEEQVSRAHLAGCMIIVAEDANAKLGPNLIPHDPHQISENGKLLAGMIDRQSLSIINASEKCRGGPITRRRIAKGKLEESCIDYILTSQDLDKQLIEAMIDSKQLYTLTKFTSTKGICNIKKSDHFSLIATFNIK